MTKTTRRLIATIACLLWLIGAVGIWFIPWAVSGHPILDSQMLRYVICSIASYSGFMGFLETLQWGRKA